MFKITKYLTPPTLIQSPSPTYTVILEASQKYYDRVFFTTDERGQWGGGGEETTGGEGVDKEWKGELLKLLIINCRLNK